MYTSTRKRRGSVGLIVHYLELVKILNCDPERFFYRTPQIYRFKSSDNKEWMHEIYTCINIWNEMFDKYTCTNNDHAHTLQNKWNFLIIEFFINKWLFFKPLQISFHEKESVLNLHPDVHVNQTHEIMNTKILFSKQ